jgi:agmatinase
LTLNPDVLTWCGVPYHPDGKWVNNPGDIKNPLLEPSDMCIVGVPYDAGQTGVSGQSAAPSAIRLLETLSSWQTHDIGDLSMVKAVDAGDLNIDHRVAQASLNAAVGKIAQLIPNTKTLVALGGDHSISAAMLEAYPDSVKPIVVHLDAHKDTYRDDDCVLGMYPTHASWVDWVLMNGYTDEVFQFGVRAVGPDANEDEHLTMIQTNTGVLTKEALEIFVRYLTDTSAKKNYPVHLSVDMDVVDPAFCPAVSYPEPGGWTSRELLETIEYLVEKLNVVGVDIVEITPSLDVRDMSVRLAHRSVLAVMRGIKRRQRQ